MIGDASFTMKRQSNYLEVTHKQFLQWSAMKKTSTLFQLRPCRGAHLLVLLVFLFTLAPAQEQEQEQEQLQTPIDTPPTAHPFQWNTWKKTSWNPSYFSVLPGSKQGVTFWFGARINRHGLNAVIRLPGPDLGQLQRQPPAFTADIIQAYDRIDEGTPIISRVTAHQLSHGNIVIVSGIGPTYTGGGSELYPALFLSDASGKNWQHLGTLNGEPQTWLDQRRRSKKLIRCEGGGLIELPSGKLRLYLQGFGVRLALAEADSLHGPWAFHRDSNGEIVDILAGLPGGWLFPAVMTCRIPHKSRTKTTQTTTAELGYFITGANTWPPTQLDAAYSINGIDFQGFDQPLLLPSDIHPKATSMKALRGLFKPEENTFEAMANIWDPQQRAYVCYHSSSPFNPTWFGRLQNK
jgi:hypothetical protein